MEVKKVIEEENVECEKCNNLPEEYISLNCGHNFCLVCLLVMESKNVVKEGSDEQPQILCDILCSICSQNTVLDKISTQALMNTLHEFIQDQKNVDDDSSNQVQNDERHKHILDQQQQSYIKMDQQQQQQSQQQQSQSYMKIDDEDRNILQQDNYKHTNIVYQNQADWNSVNQKYQTLVQEYEQYDDLIDQKNQQQIEAIHNRFKLVRMILDQKEQEIINKYNITLQEKKQQINFELRNVLNIQREIDNDKNEINLNDDYSERMRYFQQLKQQIDEQFYLESMIQNQIEQLQVYVQQVKLNDVWHYQKKNMRSQLTEDVSEYRLQNDRVLKTELSGIENHERKSNVTRFEEMMNKFRNEIKSQNGFSYLNTGNRFKAVDHKNQKINMNSLLVKSPFSKLRLKQAKSTNTGFNNNGNIFMSNSNGFIDSNNGFMNSNNCFMNSNNGFMNSNNGVSNRLRSKNNQYGLNMLDSYNHIFNKYEQLGRLV